MRANKIAIERGRFISNPGCPIKPVYSPILQKNGMLELQKIGEENTDEIIASYYESTTLEVILSKFVNGDLSALNRYQPIYMDVTKAPKTLAEAQQAVINSQYAFDALPTDIKQKFGNNFNVWLAEAGSDEWLKAMNVVMPKPEEVVIEKEVAETKE